MSQTRATIVSWKYVKDQEKDVCIKLYFAFYISLFLLYHLLLCEICFQMFAKPQVIVRSLWVFQLFVLLQKGKYQRFAGSCWYKVPVFFYTKDIEYPPGSFLKMQISFFFFVVYHTMKKTYQYYHDQNLFLKYGILQIFIILTFVKKVDNMKVCQKYEGHSITQWNF